MSTAKPESCNGQCIPAWRDRANIPNIRRIQMIYEMLLVMQAGVRYTIMHRNFELVSALF